VSSAVKHNSLPKSFCGDVRIISSRRGTSSFVRQKKKTILKDDMRAKTLPYSHEIILGFYFSTAIGWCLFFFFFFFITSTHKIVDHTGVVVTVVLTATSEIWLSFLSFCLRVNLSLYHRVVSNSSIVKAFLYLSSIALTFSREFLEKLLEEEGDIVRAFS
jgi:hypothetical protein